LTSSDTHNTPLDALIARQRPGWSLEQPFFTSPYIFDIERRGWLAKQWFLLGHRSEAPAAGSYIVRELLGESLIIVRDGRGVLRGFYNVCRHLGSRICDRDGKSNSLVCPYHGWGYLLDGSLRSAAALPANIDPASLGLHPVPVREVGGLILTSLTGSAPNADAIAREFEAGLRFHGIPEARVAARRSYPIHANWKLAFAKIARDIADPGQTWKTLDTWSRERAHPGSPLPISDTSPTTPICSASRAPIGAGRQTQSEDGLPVAPLMGKLTHYDGGVSLFRCEPFIFLAALNDHAVMVRFLPAAADETRLELTWLVNSSARESQVDLERMTRVWDMTVLQDKELVERNAAGIRSRAYTPGPFSELESKSARFVSRYLGELRAP